MKLRPLVLALVVSAVAFVALSPLPKHPVKHIVVFKYKSKATEAQITEVSEAFKALKNKIPGILSFESGVNNSPEKLNKGFTHVYLLTFEDAAARDAYLPHAEHKKFGELLGRLDVLEEPFVIDFQVE